MKPKPWPNSFSARKHYVATYKPGGTYLGKTFSERPLCHFVPWRPPLPGAAGAWGWSWANGTGMQERNERALTVKQSRERKMGVKEGKGGFQGKIKQTSKQKLLNWRWQGRDYKKGNVSGDCEDQNDQRQLWYQQVCAVVCTHWKMPAEGREGVQCVVCCALPACS